MSKNVPATWPGHKTKTKIKQIQSDARLGCNVSLNRLVTLGYDTGQLGTRLVSHLDAVLLVDLHARGCGERRVGERRWFGLFMLVYVQHLTVDFAATAT